MTIARLVIPEFERAFVWKRGSFAGILEAGVRWIVAPFERVMVQLYDAKVPEFEHPHIDLLLRQARSTMERHFDIVEVGAREVGVVFKNGRPAGVLTPGMRQLYWKGSVEVRVSKIDISNGPELPQALAKLLAGAEQPLATQIADAVTALAC